MLTCSYCSAILGGVSNWGTARDVEMYKYGVSWSCSSSSRSLTSLSDALLILYSFISVAMKQATAALIVSSVVLSAAARTFTVKNNCGYTVWYVLTFISGEGMMAHNPAKGPLFSPI